MKNKLSLALSAFFQLVKETNKLAAEEKLGKSDAQVIKKEFERMSIILGLNVPKMTEDTHDKQGRR